MIHWLFFHGGLSSANSPWYLFWSGIGADWTRLLAVGSIIKLMQQRAAHHAELTDMHERHHREIIGGSVRHPPVH